MGSFLFYFDVAVSAEYGCGPDVSSGISQSSVGLRSHKLPLTVWKLKAQDLGNWT